MSKTDKTQRKERGEDGKIRAYFERLFSKYDVRNEQQFALFAKWLIFILLCIVQLLILLRHFEYFFSPKGWWKVLPLQVNVAVFTLSEALKLFVVKNKKLSVAFYVLNAVSACAFLFLASGTYALIVYMLVLTEFYTTVKRGKAVVWIYVLCVPIYALIYTARMLAPEAVDIPLPVLLQESIGAFVLLTTHFLFAQIALAFYRQFLRLDKTLKELNESKKELEKAYAAVREVSVLEERQRIAKEIHDTAGHSLTTVIMQTESAKLIVEDNPEEAKSKIVAANLQARHALEELRDSVHLLSGATAQKSLKDELLSIIHESTDGTGIKIRSDVGEVAASQAKHRFLCNTLKEGIANGLRHGGATAFWFECKQEENKITFLLSDNGKGADGNTVRKGFGLTTMEERARALGGEIAFSSEDGEGFEIRMELPAEIKE
ncbi:MAG: sensor histidine kinase [Clostridia bacterium]|nr:sensor histidine kinase [Clostridia bacterium]